MTHDLSPSSNNLFLSSNNCRVPSPSRQLQQQRRSPLDDDNEGFQQESPFGIDPSDSVGGSNPLEKDLLCAKLTSIGFSPDDFRPVLIEAQLSGLGLTSVNAIRDFRNLQIVRMRNNKLRCLHPLNLLTFLTVLDAANNEIESSEELMPNACLEVVDLSQNRIKRLGDWSFNPRLRILKLAGNAIASLEGNLRDNALLQHLDLSENLLESLEDLPPSLSIEELLVANNRIKSLQGVEALAKLAFLNAHGNRLTCLYPVSAETAPNLLHLDVGGNPEFRNIRLLTPLEKSSFFCSLNLFPGPLEEVDWLRVKVIHMLQHLEVLNGEPVTTEEKVKVEEAYGEEVEGQRRIWEAILPGEPFPDRRLLKAHDFI
ncbi:leucine rich repeat-containing protein [Toxoplasma gondii TgCatPRC2]|uniref:Leucine rich repeat-containing protein n=4 Tax=Toxoplasma gondii TaxID=5811 RepID=A0A151HP75_TOXGO|nr:leucine rich repeat-containing protein [Toxoplasma gondii ME49]EPT28501.1 leucine rich repeat-containing protein [Toxoplasma gondii ME49]KYF46892.1 leucine rich repeat-containing protein [Toxoplasma gondii ARI]KYK71132.1 leucine rich repeat-containing protein [Toxoplasma gondii TgCatPRC2]PIM01262.1 leucine rich repeat-containing protein [Toxoplasma gondii COUG]|eukprot:XP_018636650.1 leucine rich repeat-containing protein [Toxoplasma gondii ME49]